MVACLQEVETMSKGGMKGPKDPRGSADSSQTGMLPPNHSCGTCRTSGDGQADLAIPGFF
jgi:hypothetical protein